MSPEVVRDVLANLEARGLLLNLDARGIHLQVRRGNLSVAADQAAHLTQADVGAIKQHKPDLLVLVLICTDAVLDRLLALQRGEQQVVRSTGCYLCGHALPAGRDAGRCGPCALAVRLYVGAPVPASVLDLFDTETTGRTTTPAAGLAYDLLQFDEQVPA